MSVVDDLASSYPRAVRVNGANVGNAFGNFSNSCTRACIVAASSASPFISAKGAADQINISTAPDNTSISPVPLESGPTSVPLCALLVDDKHSLQRVECEVRSVG